MASEEIERFLTQYEELKEKEKLNEEEREIYEANQNTLLAVGNALDFVKSGTLVIGETCYSLSSSSLEEYADDVYTLTGGFNKEFMNAVKDIQKEKNDLEITVVNKQEYKELVNAPLQLEQVKKELSSYSNRELEMSSVLRCTEDKYVKMQPMKKDNFEYPFDMNNIANSVLGITLTEAALEDKKYLVAIADLDIEMPKPMTLYEVHHLDKENNDTFVLANDTRLAMTTALIMMNDLDVHIVNRDTKEEIDLDSKELEERVVAKLDSTKEFEKTKDSVPVITTNNANEVGTVRNGQAVVLETASDLGDLERETAGSSSETVTNEMLRFEEKIGRKVTDIELIEETVQEMITEARENVKFRNEELGADNIENDKFSYDDIEI